MRKVITFTSMVGGTGKTSLLANLATVLTQDLEKRVLCLGLAPDLPLWFRTPPGTNYSASAQRLPTPHPTSCAVQTNKTAPAYLILRQTEKQAQQVLQQVTSRETEYDYVLVEARYSIYPVVRAAYLQADLVLIAGGLNRFETPTHQHDLVAQIAPLLSENRLKPAPMRTVLSVRVPRLTGEEEYMPAETLRRLETQYEETYRQPGLPPVCATQICADEAYEEALCECRPVALSHPHSRTVTAYRLLAQELLAIVHGD